jgi:hypothetical protein
MEVLRTKMDVGGKYDSRTGNRVARSGVGGFRGQGQGKAFAQQGYQCPYQRYDNPSFYASCGGGCRYEQRSHSGYGGRQPDFRMGFGGQNQQAAPDREVGANVHGGRANKALKGAA